MDVNAILSELHSELRRIDLAILALQRLAPFPIGDMPTQSAVPTSLSAQKSEGFADMVSDPVPHLS